MKSEHMVDISVSSVERVQMIYIELVIPQVFSCDILEYKKTQVIKCVERDCAFKNKYQMTRHMVQKDLINQDVFNEILMISCVEWDYAFKTKQHMNWHMKS